MFCVGGNANFSVLRYQHVGIPNLNCGVGGLSQSEDPILKQNCGIGGLSQRGDPMRMVLRRSGI